MKQVIVIICVIIGFCGGIVESSRCLGAGEAPTSRQLLDLDLLLGEWKMLRAGPASASSNRTTDCNSYTISKKSDSIHFLNNLYTERINGSVYNKVNELITVKQLSVPSRWDMWSQDGYMPTDVVATDYENYMILYMCNDQTDQEPVWLIFCRRIIMNEVLMEALYSFVEGFGFTRDRFLHIGHQNC